MVDGNSKLPFGVSSALSANADTDSRWSRSSLHICCVHALDVINWISLLVYTHETILLVAREVYNSDTRTHMARETSPCPSSLSPKTYATYQPQ